MRKGTKLKVHLCSDTIHDSKAENNNEVDNPPNTRPISSRGIDGICSIKLITIYQDKITSNSLAYLQNAKNYTSKSSSPDININSKKGSKYRRGQESS